MRFRRSLQAAVATALLVSPLAAIAQTVTTVPIAQPAPVLAMPMLIALVVGLVGLGIYSIRARSARVVAGFALITGLSLVVGLSYAALPGVSVDGAECDMRTTQSYNFFGDILTSHCPNLIKIVEITCGHTDVLNVPALCVVGQTLTNGQSCLLPSCD